MVWKLRKIKNCWYGIFNYLLKKQGSRVSASETGQCRYLSIFTVKPLWCPLYSGVHYREVLPKLNIFCPKNCSRVLGYSAINQSVSKDQCWEKKEPKGNILEDIMYIWLFGRHWLTSVCNAWSDQRSKWKRRMPLLWFVLILTVKKNVVGHMQQKYQWLYPRL